MWTAPLTVLGSVCAIAAVARVHAAVPLLASLYRLQLPVCLYLFVAVKAAVQRCAGPPCAPRPQPHDVYACVRTLVGELYGTFLVLLGIKVWLERAALAPL